VRGRGQGQVEVQVGGSERFGVVQVLLHAGVGATEALEVAGIGAAGGQPGALDLDGAAHFLQVVIGVGRLAQLQEQLQRGGGGAHGEFLHVGAAARLDAQEPAHGEDAQRLTHDGAADAEAFGEVALRGQPVARPQGFRDDQGLDLVGDLLIQAVAQEGKVEHLGHRRPFRGTGTLVRPLLQYSRGCAGRQPQRGDGIMTPGVCRRASRRGTSSARGVSAGAAGRTRSLARKARSG